MGATCTLFRLHRLKYTEYHKLTEQSGEYLSEGAWSDFTPRLTPYSPNLLQSYCETSRLISAVPAWGKSFSQIHDWVPLHFLCSIKCQISPQYHNAFRSWHSLKFYNYIFKLNCKVRLNYEKWHILPPQMCSLCGRVKPAFTWIKYALLLNDLWTQYSLKKLR